MLVQVPWYCGGSHSGPWRAEGRQLRPAEPGRLGQVRLRPRPGLGEGADAGGQDQGVGEEGWFATFRGSWFSWFIFTEIVNSYELY